ncbi:CYTH and CHAD domain-containing protein [Serinibacter salmoneus]|uniref:CHAD domain-containing protein n=1 Tax=Serinibacter salmoneus TaxID=556530 RepID=A0A2A9D399_9MICO|nr:CYTH and CHAD domain-containing protein [Serinibacter salmoneus]PFG20816.1 CHAD domain-containing protein [Serinibacter salmoneus]
MTDTPLHPAVHLEREVKVQLPNDADLAPRLHALLESDGSARELRFRAGSDLDLTAVYVDTRDARLARWGVTLRRRTGGPDTGWQLKLPASLEPSAARSGVSERLELHAPLEAPVPESDLEGTAADVLARVGGVPLALGEITAALLRDADLVPMGLVRTHRRRWEVTRSLPDGGAEAVAELVQDSVTAWDSRGVLTEAFREVEVEALTDDDGVPLPGSRKALKRLTRAFAELGATPSASGKGARALGEVATGPADVVVHEVTPDSPAREVLAAAIATHVRALLLADVGVRRGEREAVHRFRVSERRLRSVLRTWAPLLEAQWCEHLVAELVWIGGEFGPARDGQVQRDLLGADLERLEETVAWPQAAGEIRDALAARESRGLERGLRAMRSARYTALLHALVAAAAAPALDDDTAQAAQSDGGVLVPLVEDRVSQLRSALRDLDADSGEGWHRARIRAKGARYAVDVLVQAGVSRARKPARRLARITDALGDVQDDAVGLEALRELAGEVTSTQAGFLLGLLDAVVRTRAKRHRARVLARCGAWRRELRRRLL